MMMLLMGTRRERRITFVPLVVVMMVLKMIVAVVLVEPAHVLNLLMLLCKGALIASLLQSK
jgi:hypothetical protein